VAVYVGYRKQHPDEETVQKVLEELKENNIYINMLDEWPTNHCQLTQSPEVEDMGIGKQSFEILNIL
jgi:hypothetical protein